ncbi:sulfotransferase [uncultured Winogradskyella sp.]|uniref:sulfotransferase family protein n=1 Tax=uncultured Winogradskyella sp. TaxID=395353 RepID=UPI00262F9978|nr:sulfotransferase [uncultured Winogradskyella sp.]
MKTSPFFIVGVQRSGTTLLRLLLNSHSEIAVPEEASFLKPLLKKKWIKDPICGEKLEKMVNYLRKNEQFKLWNFDREPLLQEIENKSQVTIKEVMEIMYSSYASHESKSIWGDKSLFFSKMELIFQMFPKAKFIHIVRDGRDVFNSWRKMDQSMSNPSVMALDWGLKTYLVEKSMQNIPKENLLLIRYEDLLNNPKQTLESICKFINVGFEDKMLRFHQTSNKYIGKHHSDLIFKAIDNSNIKKWERLLTSKEKRIYQIISGRYLKKYGYDVSEKIKLKNWFEMFWDLLLGLPKRTLQLIKVRLAYRRALYKGESTKTKVGQLPEEKSIY